MCEGWGGAEVARALPANFDQISVKAPTVAFRYIRLTLYFRYKCTTFVRYVRYTTRARCRQRRCPKIGCTRVTDPLEPSAPTFPPTGRAGPNGLPSSLSAAATVVASLTEPEEYFRRPEALQRPVATCYHFGDHFLSQ